jgi:hypothetical protein
MIIIVIIAIFGIAIAASYFTNVREGVLNIMQFSLWGFILVIISGALAFFGYVAERAGAHGTAKFLVNACPVVLFVGAIIVESAFFGTYLAQTSSISVTSCKESMTVNSVEQIPMFTTCLFTAYYPSQGMNFASLSFATFIIFFWLLPFVFMYYFFYGLFESTMGSMFGGGGTGKTVSVVISFIVAMYGARQMIGSFLIDFLAYGSWGLVGIFIPLFLAAGIKRLLNTYIATEVPGAEIWSAVGTDAYAELRNAEQRVRDANDAMQQAVALGDRNAQQAITQNMRGLANSLDGLVAGLGDPQLAHVKAGIQAVRDMIRHTYHV